MTIFGDDRSGLTINTRIAARTRAEHRAQEARAGEIVSLVDEVVGKVTLAVRKHPASAAAEPFSAAFDDLIDELGEPSFSRLFPCWKRMRPSTSRGSWAAKPCWSR
ncbi:hypothetical protein [Bradyrhizobium sp. CCBAU 11361]|uniref:hypothetical protein n=1 Tax=Bradyrhizobium sp. CCBAU 11361 TaxID=1630812 RepID=UPI00230272F7|nr:hypothetical protein [Bradyrhizobium sp. CCBAU 11361]